MRGAAATDGSVPVGRRPVQKSLGYLTPILVLPRKAGTDLPERAWQQSTTDLVTDLLESEGKIAIAVFVDRLTKMMHFFPAPRRLPVLSMLVYSSTRCLGCMGC